MATTYDVNGDWTNFGAAAPRFEVERGATSSALTLNGIIGAGQPAVIVAIVRDAHHERTLAKYLCEHHRFSMRSWVAYTAGSRQQVQFVHRDHMERAHGLRADVVVGQIPVGWTGRLLATRGFHVRGEPAERAFWGMAEQRAPLPPLAPVLTVDGHRCPASVWVDVAVHADGPHGPTRTTVDIAGEVADGDPFVARVESACRDRGVVVAGVALGDGKSTTLQGFVCSFGMAGHRLTAKLVCAPVRVVAEMTPEAKRRAAEAPLVALVNTVPKGLDPVGWRAAALAVWEGVRLHPLPGQLVEWIRCEAPREERTDGSWLAHSEYLRAVAPQGPRPKPERRRAPGLPLDVDADLAGLDAKAGRL